MEEVEKQIKYYKNNIERLNKQFIEKNNETELLQEIKLRKDCTKYIMNKE